MSGYDEAVDWFRADPERVRDLDDVDNRSAAITIVNAVLAGAVPAGRGLTANDVRDAYLAVEPFDDQGVVDYLNRIARPSGGVGQPETGEQYDEQDAEDPVERLTAALERRSLELKKALTELHELRTGIRDSLGIDTGVPVTDEGLVEDVVEWIRRARAFAPEPVPADPSPRSWSLPAPPPDDVTVVHAADQLAVKAAEVSEAICGSEEMASEILDDAVHAYRMVRDSEYAGARIGTLVEGEPPAPEPQAAESASVILFKPSGKYYTEERWVIPSNAIGPYDMERSPDFRRINGGAVLVETQEPWGFPHLFPGVATAGAVREEGQ